MGRWELGHDFYALDVHSMNCSHFLAANICWTTSLVNKHSMSNMQSESSASTTVRSTEPSLCHNQNANRLRLSGQWPNIEIERPSVMIKSRSNSANDKLSRVYMQPKPPCCRVLPPIPIIMPVQGQYAMSPVVNHISCPTFLSFPSFSPPKSNPSRDVLTTSSLRGRSARANIRI